MCSVPQLLSLRSGEEKTIPPRLRFSAEEAPTSELRNPISRGFYAPDPLPKSRTRKPGRRGCNNLLPSQKEEAEDGKETEDFSFFIIFTPPKELLAPVTSMREG